MNAEDTPQGLALWQAQDDERDRLAYQQALHGDLTAAIARLQIPVPTGTGRTAGWRLLLRASVSVLGSQDLATPTPDDARSHAGGPASDLAAVACAHMATAALASLDGAALQGWADTAAALARATPSSSSTTALVAHSLALWQRLVQGEPEGIVDEAATLAAQARRVGLSATVVECGVLRALALLATGDADAALDAARRASRASRSEGLLAQEYLANVALARVRRRTGATHMAARILAALARVVPAAWQRWTNWELLLAGAGMTETDEPDAPTTRLEHVLTHAQRGDARAFADHEMRLLARVRTVAFLDEDARAMLAALDPRRDAADLPDAMRAFCLGDGGYPPFAMDGLLGPDDDDAFAPVVVLAVPGRPARRVLTAGLALLPPEQAPLRVPEGRPRQHRVYALLSVLLLAGPDGIDEPTLFRQVYGFEYVPDRHVGPLKTVLHRARGELGDLVHIERGDGRLAITVKRAIAVADPRCQPSLHDRVLRKVASNLGRLSAQEAARQVGVSLRYAQAALQQLVDDGLCTVEKVGREVAYRIEDTTFYEPTLDRLRPQG